MTGKPGRPQVLVPADRPSPRLGNVPLPEPYLLGIAASAGLNRVRPRALPGSPLTHRLAGAPLIAAGTIVIARSLQAAGQVSSSYSPAPGSTPNCCSTLARSVTDQYSTIFPSRMRWITMPSVPISLFVAGIPSSSPVCSPRPTM
jgi:hypothetical protein